MIDKETLRYYMDARGIQCEDDETLEILARVMEDVIEDAENRAKENKKKRPMARDTGTRSIVALASYPFVIEPGLTLHAQQIIWSWGFGLFALASGYCVFRQWRNSAGTIEQGEPAEDLGGVTLPTVAVKFLWFALSAAGSVSE